jgi:hypothetical protein
MKNAATQDAYETICNCGQRIRMIRRGPVALIPAGHKCPARETQEAVMRTIQAEELCGLHVSLTEYARRLRHWGVGDALVLNGLRGPEGE